MCGLHLVMTLKLHVWQGMTRMSFWLCHLSHRMPPTTSCILMNHVFNGYLDKFVVVYLDDTVLWGTLEYQKLSVVGWERINWRWRMRSVSLLARCNGHGALSLKRKCMHGWMKATCHPRMVSDNQLPGVRVFSWFGSYYPRFIKGYCKKVPPLKLPCCHRGLSKPVVALLLAIASWGGEVQPNLNELVQVIRLCRSKFTKF